MNIRNNIINYLYDKDYVACLYEDFFYIFNYKYLESFNDNKIVVTLEDREIKLLGEGLTIIKVTKEELLIKGTIKTIETKGLND